MDRATRRINIIIGEDQYEALGARGANVSGLIRELLSDHLSAHTVTLRVSEETRRLYDLLVSNGGVTDEELESHLRASLARALERRIAEMQALYRRVSGPGSSG